MRRVTVPLLAVVLLALARPAAGDDRLFIRPWVELEPVVRIDEGDYPIPLETAGRWLLEEARTLLSGMVYGWTFTWTPGDTARKVEDRFDLVPVAEIPRGSERLVVRQTEVAEARLFAQVSYQMSPSEDLRRRSWAGAAVDEASGAGEAPVLDGRAAKLLALANAIKDAVRGHLRTRILNKPREIRGEVVLWEDPRAWVASGAYRATAKVRLRVLDVIPYRIF